MNKITKIIKNIIVFKTTLSGKKKLITRAMKEIGINPHITLLSKKIFSSWLKILFLNKYPQPEINTVMIYM